MLTNALRMFDCSTRTVSNQQNLIGWLKKITIKICQWSQVQQINRMLLPSGSLPITLGRNQST